MADNLYREAAEEQNNTQNNNHLDTDEEDDILHHGGFSGFWKVLRSKVSELSVLQLIWIIILMIFMMAGNALQLIGLNFWLKEFPYQGQSASFTILAMSGIVFALFFIVAFIGYVIVKRPNMAFAKDWKGWVLLIGIGFTDTFNSFMNIYAANTTPEVLQALFQALMPLWTCVMTKYILHDPRAYINRWILASFGLTIAGIIIAAVPDFLDGDDTEDESQRDKIGWSAIFFFSVPLTALMNVWQTKYMEDYTLTDEDKELLAGSNTGSDVGIENTRPSMTSSVPAEQAGLLQACDDHDEEKPKNGTLVTKFNSNNNGSANSNRASSNDDAVTTEDRKAALKFKGEDAIVKLMMLFGDTTIQAAMSLCLLPADALPWWGGADTTADAAMHFRENSTAIFTDWRCSVYCAVYSSGFVFTYIGGAYLNQYSPTLCCMIGQLSSPMTALVLIIIPALNVGQGSGAWYWSVIAVVLLTIGTLLYSAWEEMSMQEEARKERQNERERRIAERAANNLPSV